MTAFKVGRIGKFDFNPRGNLWMNDENRFGHKLLMKMGWSHGKGLGKNETGITENLKVKVKRGNTGVGWDEKLSFGVDTHDLDAVLESLNKKFQKSNGDEVKTDNTLISIEKRSRQFKNRLHYQKFLKGKDVSRCSDKDMNGIFITKTLKSDAKSAVEEATISNVNNLSDDVSTEDPIQTFKSELSMTDYFARKSKNKLGESSKGNTDSKEEPQCRETPSLRENQATCRKRKKECKSSKKTKKRRLSKLDIIHESNSSTKEVLDENIAEEFSSDICNDKVFKKTKLSHKKSKKFLKNKVQVLKSCLKKSLKHSAKFWIEEEPKKVSFSDNISYKIIENVLNEIDVETPKNEATEAFEELLSCNSICNESETSEDEEIEETKSYSIFNGDSTNDELVKDELLNNSSKCDQLKNLLPNDAERDVEERPECLDFSTCDGSNYYSWLKAQRTAMKVKTRNSVLKKIKRHPILHKTNLSDIKGYGNWGF